MSITGSLRNAGSMASSAGFAMVAGIQRVGEKVRALSGSTNFGRPALLSAVSGGSAHQTQMTQSAIGMPSSLSAIVSDVDQTSDNISEQQFIQQVVSKCIANATPVLNEQSLFSGISSLRPEH